MSKTIALLALAATVTAASAQTVTNLFPNGDFSGGGPTADWLEINGNGAAFTYSYPATGGNPDHYGIIDNTAGGSWGIWVGGAPDPGLSLESLGLIAGNTYTFVQDMKILAGSSIGGVKIESWGPSGQIGNSGDMRPSTAGKNTAAWETYAFTYQIAFGATAIKVVPLWGPNSSVAYDNLGVVVPLSTPLSAAITFPANGAVLNTNFTISASAAVAPGSITNVNFYRNGTLIGSDDTGPYSLNVVGAPVGPAALTVVAQSSTGASVTSAVVNVTITANLTETIVRIDPTKSWAGFMTVYETPQNFGAQVFNSPWGTADLSAQFSGSGPTTLTLRPAPMADAASFWYDYTDPNYPVGANGAVANKDMEAVFYVTAPAATLNGNLVTFTGKVLTNSLVNPARTNLAGNGWTSVAFIRDFAPDYSSFVETNIALTNGVTFSISLLTDSDPARHIQYGFITRGPNVWPTDVNNYGAVVLEALDASPTNVTVKSTAPWLGFMNVSNTPQDGGTYQFGSPWAPADLKAVFNDQGLVLSPNNIGDPNPYWYIGGGGPGAVGNKIMDASMYVEIGSLPGRTLVFSGTVLSNGLVSASNTNAAGNGWTSVAFIKDFAPDYSSFNQVTVPLNPGAFSITLQTVNDPARHVQYGFQTVGPNVWATDSAPFGAVVIADTAVVAPTLTATLSGGNIRLSFATQTGKTYAVQYKTNLTDPTWQSLTTTNGTGATAIVTDAANQTRRFYQVQVQ